MEFRFWKRKSVSAGGSGAGAQPKPKELPQQVGRFLVVEKGEEPDWVWSLKIAHRHRPDDKDIRDFRIFDPARVSMRSIDVKNYDALDDHPDLICFSGWFNKRDGTVSMDPK